MIKTTEFVKASGSTMFFPKIIVTKEEMERLCNNAQVDLCWIRMVVSNYEDFGSIAFQHRPQGMKTQLYHRLVDEWS